MTSRFDPECWICDAQDGIVAFGGGGGSSPPSNTTTTTNTNPWSGQQPYLSDYFQQAQNLYTGQPISFNNTNAPKYYGGTNDPGAQNTVAQFTQPQLNAINAATNLAQNDPTANAATGTSGAYLSGAMTGLNPENAMLSPFLNGSLLSAGNPYFQQSANATLANVVPGLEAQFNQGNSFNNPGVAYAVSQGAADALAPYAFSNYQQGLSNALAAAQQVGQNYNTDYGNQLKALGLAPQTQALNFNDISQLYNAGAESQAQNQANLNAAISQWNYNQQLPMQMLANYGNSIQGDYGSTSTLTQPYFTNPAANALGGALGGAALGGMLGGPLFGSGGGGYGALGGAGLGALLAFM